MVVHYGQGAAQGGSWTIPKQRTAGMLNKFPELPRNYAPKKSKIFDILEATRNFRLSCSFLDLPMRFLRVTTAMLFCLAAMGFSHAETSQTTVTIGVLTDASGPFADQAGRGSDLAARMAAEDFAAESPDYKVNVLLGDHQNKPDIGFGIVRKWVDEDNVNAVVDVPNSAVALAINDFLAEHHRTFLASGVATSDLSGKYCKPTTVQWVRDTWALANAEVHALTEKGGKKWFFISYDYALGRALERDAGAALAKRGGMIIGSAHHPVNTSDFSSYLLQAMGSGAEVIALADTGNDAITAIKQASEFGLAQQGLTLASLFLELSDVDAIGLQAGQGLILTQGFYWDLNEKTRAWATKFAARNNGRMPTDDQAGVYSSTLAYLHAVRATNSTDGEKDVAQMASSTIDDPLYGPTTVRKDGRAIHAMHVFKIKAPSASRGKWDYYELVSTIPPEEAFRPLAEGDCPLVK
jgi:branched-chain amino acid transport system substrate-binding protein